MNISETGLNLIKSFEGCKLTAYKAVSTETYYTIGWGHYGSDVTAGMTITQEEADALLVSDLAKYETKVNKYIDTYNFNQNQFDALVSFAYNIGSIDGLTAKGTRTISQISSKFSAYVKSGGVTLSGLVKRRAAEKTLFDAECETTSTTTYEVPTPTLKQGSSGSEVKKLQAALNYLISAGLTVDGSFGTKTKIAVKAFQANYNLTVDGIYGSKSYAAMKTALGV